MLFATNPFHGARNGRRCGLKSNIVASVVEEIKPNKLTYLGIDGCKGGWCVALYNGVFLKLEVLKKLSLLVEFLPSAEICFIDMPIGLSSQGTPRYLDEHLRNLLRSGTKSSAFNAPCRQAVYAYTYEEAKSINKTICGKSLSMQSWNICDKIKELDTYLQSSSLLQNLVFEMHPELCFQRLWKDSNVYSKKSEQGAMMRSDILKNYIDQFESTVDTFLVSNKRQKVLKDDVLDACILAVAASLWDRSSYVMDYHQMDECGISMRMPQIICREI